MCNEDILGTCELCELLSATSVTFSDSCDATCIDDTKEGTKSDCCGLLPSEKWQSWVLLDQQWPMGSGYV